jgi:hypothetical protein
MNKDANFLLTPRERSKEVENDVYLQPGGKVENARQ